MADIADIGFRVDTGQLDTAKGKVTELFRGIGQLSDQTNKVNQSVQSVADRVDNSARRQVQAHGRTRDAVNETNKSIQSLADRVESGATRQIAAHARTRRAVQDMAAQAQVAAAQQQQAFQRIEAAIQRQNLVATSAMMAQYDQMERLITQMGRARSAQQQQTRATIEAANASKRLTNVASSLQDRLLGTANAVAVLDGPLGGVASRFSSLAVLVGRFGIAGGAVAVVLSAISVAAVQSVGVFRELETSFLRLDKLANNLTGSLGVAGPQLQALVNQTAFATLESVETVNQAVMNIIGLQGVSAENLERIVTTSADMAAAGMGDIGSSSKALAMALDDPERALSRLNRRIQMFSKDEMEAIKMMSAMGRESEAQAAILERVESTVGGLGETFGNLDGNMDTISQGTQALLRGFGSFIVSGLQLEAVTGSVAASMKNMSDEMDRSRGIIPLGEDPVENVRILKDELDKAGTELERAIGLQNEYAGTFAIMKHGVVGLPLAIAEARSRESTALERIFNLNKAINANENAEKKRSERVQSRLNLLQQEVELTQQLLNTSGGDTAFREFARTSQVPLQAENEAVDEFLKRIKMTKDEYDELLDLTRQRFGQQGIRSLITQSDNLVDSLRQSAAETRILVDNYDELSKLPKDLQGAFVMIEKLLEMEGVDEGSERIRTLRAAMAELIAEKDRLAEVESVQSFDDAVVDAGASVQVALNKLRLVDETVGMTVGQKAREEAIQKAINDATVKLNLTEEQQLRLRKEVESLSAKTLQNIEDQADANARNLELEKKRSAYMSALTATAGQTRSYEERTFAAERELDLLQQGKSLIDAKAQAEADLTRRQLTRVAQQKEGGMTSEDASRIEAEALARFELARRAGTSAEALDAYKKSLSSVKTETAKFSEEVRDLLLSLDPAAKAAFDLSEKVDTLNQAQAAGLITTQQYRDAVQQLSSEFEASQDPIANFYQELEKLQDMDRLELGALENAQDALADFLFDPFAEGIEGMVGQFADAMRRMVAEALSAKIMESAMGAFGLGGASGGASGGDGGAAALTSAATTLQASGGTLTTSGGTLASAGGVLSSSGGLLSGSAAALSAAAAALSASAAAASVSNAVSSIPMMDKGGSLAPGQAGIVGEIGPELVFGPATVIGREQTQNIYRAQEEERKAMEEAKAAKSGAVGLSGMAGMSGGLIQMLLMMLAQGNGLGLGSLFAGLFDQGGYIPPGKMGIAGELGPELIAGPANVTSRRETSSMMAQKAPEMNAKIINVLDPSIVGQYMNSADGEKLILNVLSENGVL